MQTLKLEFHSDPGHGWLKVPRSIVKKLGIQVSPYSFEKGEFLYLEEDCDASRFDAAAKAQGIAFEVTECVSNTMSAIRNYRRVSMVNL